MLQCHLQYVGSTACGLSNLALEQQLNFTYRDINGIGYFQNDMSPQISVPRELKANMLADALFILHFI
jgi:hypothetical protein